MALNFYLALFQTCIPENLLAFPSLTKHPIFFMLLCFHDTTTIFQ